MFEFVIKRKTFISMFFIGITLMGYISYRNLNVEMLPNAELPFLIVQVAAVRDMDPGYLEKEAVIPVESAIGTLDGIEKVESSIDRRQGRIFVSYKPGVNLKYAYLRLQEKIDAMKGELGDDFRVMTMKVDTQMLANMFMNLQVRGSGGTDRIRQVVEKEIRSELESIDGIANIEVFGGREKSVEIIMNEQTARAYNITPSTIRTLIARNSQNRMYVGQIDQKDQKYFVNVIAEYTDIADLENIIVNEQVPLRLKDVASVYQGVKEETSISRINGKESITIQLVRDTRVNLIRLSEITRETIEKLNKTLSPQDIEIAIQYDSAEILNENIDLIINLAITGGILAVLILWFFLKNLPMVSVIALAIPISVFASMNLFYAFDITLNSLTLVGMALAIGMLLDSSIVVLENIYRLADKRRSPDEAAIQGTKEVWRSIFAATFTTIAVFIPFVFASNFYVQIMGYQIGISIVSTLFVSLIVALFLIPMLIHHFLDRAEKRKKMGKLPRSGRLMQMYIVLLKSAMRLPLRTIVGSLIIFFASILIALALSINVSEETELEDFNIYITLPKGTTLESTDLATTDMEERLKDIAEIQDVISQIYEEEAILTVKLKEDYKTIADRQLPDIKDDINERMKHFTAGEASFDQPSTSTRFRGGGGGGRGDGAGMGGDLFSFMGIGDQSEKVVIRGQNINDMRVVADDIEYQLNELSSIDRANLDLADNRPEIQLRFDRQLMSYFGISMASVISELSAFQKEVTSGINFKQDNEEYEITITSDDESEKTIDDLRKLPIPADNGEHFNLEQITDILYSEGTSSINRVNQDRQVEVRYRFASEITDSKSFLAAARDEVDQIVNAIEIPSGIAVEVVHDETDLSEFYFLIAVAFILIYMILASVFESLINPFIIMFTIPLAAIGSLWAIIFTGQSLLNANTMLGFLILLGIVVNNGIILIDYTRILRQRGFRQSRALVVAGLARVRPILITAITTIIALFPLAMGKAEYVTQIASPFAITVIGGLTLSTLFTLVFIPTVYALIENTLQWLAGLNWKLKLTQFVILIGGSIIIYFEVESLIWKFALFFVLLFLTPGTIYFMLRSLRQANAKLIPENEPIKISIKNLYKIYDLPGRFRREWEKGKLISQQSGNGFYEGLKKNWADRTWPMLLWGFLFYYIYMYLESKFWVFILVHLFYFWTLHIVNYYLNEFDLQEKKLFRVLPKILQWSIPAVNLAYFFLDWDKLVLTIIIAFVWYFSLVIYTTSHRIIHQQININRIKGRFAGLRTRFYRLVQMIPVLGNRKVPFCAVEGVSLEIGRGMFGLLGPNGAGKTTLMRMICGVLDQNYGTIRINNIDTRLQREELQGLIGYLPQEFGTYENMTAEEFLHYQAIIKNILDVDERTKRVNYVLSAVHLDESRDKKIGSFSGGMKQRIGIAQTLLHLPRILVVDEPTAGLDPRERIRFRNLLVDLSRERVVIFSTHIIEDVASSCDKVAVMGKGRIRYLGHPRKMADLANGKVWQFDVSPEKFEEVREKYSIIHHTRIGNKIRARCLSVQEPEFPGVVSVKPTLEDSYLYIAGKDIKATEAENEN
jgi:multidrug efflux pump subunit AcrB/ABC-type multidrug transport system ATPase subunit